MICPKCGASFEGSYRYVICPKCGEMCDALKSENIDGIKRNTVNKTKSIINEDGSYRVVFKTAQKGSNVNDSTTTSNSYQNNNDTTSKMNDTKESFSTQTSQVYYTPTESSQTQKNDSEKQENVLAGIVGATLGSLIGVVAIVIFDQLGLVAAISGFVMAICAIKGYELLGGSISTKGLIVSLVIMIVMVWVGEKAAWTLALKQEIYPDESFFTLFRNFNTLLKELNNYDAELMSSYHESLFMQYLFAALGCGSFIVSLFRSSTN